MKKVTAKDLPIKEMWWPSHLHEDHYSDKNLITIHHTVGESGESSYDYLKQRSEKAYRTEGYTVGVPFIIKRNGEIIQTFPSSSFAYNLGIGSKAVEERNVGIELANFGPLTCNGGKFYNVYGQRFPKAKVYDNGKAWRGYRYWEKFPKAQIKSLALLLHYLVQEYDIPPVFVSDFFPENPLPRREYLKLKGITSHAHYRKPREKQDVSPALKPHMEYLKKCLAQ